MSRDAAFGEDGDDVRVDLPAGLGSGGADVDLAAGQVVGQGGGQLRPAGVVHADEQQLGHLFGDPSLGLGGGDQLLAGEPPDQQGQILRDARGRLQVGAGRGDRSLDGLAGEDTGVLVGQLVHEPVVHLVLGCAAHDGAPSGMTSRADGAG